MLPYNDNEMTRESSAMRCIVTAFRRGSKGVGIALSVVGLAACSATFGAPIGEPGGNRQPAAARVSSADVGAVIRVLADGREPAIAVTNDERALRNRRSPDAMKARSLTATHQRTVAATMAEQTTHVKLPRPIQVILFYTTAAVMHEDGTIHFAEDIYRHDARLDRALDDLHQLRSATTVGRIAQKFAPAGK